MPSRTNAKQTVVYLLRKYGAAADVGVTESRLLRDAVTGDDREVDVVIETIVDGDPILISVEVLGRTRPADRPWVEQMVKKHDRLPTNKLILVSWSGFTASARACATAEGGRISVLTPEQVEEDGVPVTARRPVTAFALGWPSIVIFDVDADNTFMRLQVDLGRPILDGSRAQVGLCAELAWRLCQEGWSELADLARSHGDDADRSTYVVRRVDLAERDWYVEAPSGELLRIHRCVITGQMYVQQMAVELWLTKLGERDFFVGYDSFHGHEIVWYSSASGAPLVFRDY